MKKSTIGLLIILPIFAFLLLFAYARYSASDASMSEEEKHVKQRLAEEIAGGKNPIPIKDITDFEWDRVCIAGGMSAIEGKRLEIFPPPSDYWLLAFHKSDTWLLIGLPSHQFHEVVYLKHNESKCSENPEARLVLKQHTGTRSSYEYFDLIP